MGPPSLGTQNTRSHVQRHFRKDAAFQRRRKATGTVRRCSDCASGSPYKSQLAACNIQRSKAAWSVVARKPAQSRIARAASRRNRIADSCIPQMDRGLSEARGEIHCSGIRATEKPLIDSPEHQDLICSSSTRFEHCQNAASRFLWRWRCSHLDPHPDGEQGTRSTTPRPVGISKRAELARQPRLICRTHPDRHTCRARATARRTSAIKRKTPANRAKRRMSGAGRGKSTAKKRARAATASRTSVWLPTMWLAGAPHLASLGPHGPPRNQR
jgi:hypothetical protein